MKRTKLKDIIFANYTKVYVSADEGFEDDRSTLVKTGRTLWYIRFYEDILVIDRHTNYVSDISPKRWKECSIDTYDDLLLRVATVQLLGA